MQSFAKLAISLARQKGMYLVLDADALLLVGQDISLIRGYRRAVLTPNVVEFKRLSEQLHVDPNTPQDERAVIISQRLGGVTVLEKGKKDLVAIDTTRADQADLEVSAMGAKDSEEEKVREIIEVDVEGGMKRCGGQGDILSGAVGTFMAWGKCYEDGAFG